MVYLETTFFISILQYPKTFSLVTCARRATEHKTSGLEFVVHASFACGDVKLEKELFPVSLSSEHALYE